MRYQLIPVIVMLAAMGDAQTLVDLHTQAKSVDFSKASHTIPVQTGTSLPSTCIVGELFFKSNAPAGGNLFGCAATNTWSSQSTAGVQIQNGGVAVGTGSGVNFVAGTGMMTTVVNTDPLITVQLNVDTAVIQTRQDEQSGRGLFCASASASGTTFSCGLAPALAAYTVGMLVHWRPDVDGSGGPATLNIDARGPLPLKMFDGVTDPVIGDIVANRMEEVWYDGAIFRLNKVQAMPSNTARPDCSASQRGRIWHQPGTDGVKDVVAVCAKDGLDVYAWRTLF